MSSRLLLYLKWLHESLVLTSFTAYCPPVSYQSLALKQGPCHMFTAMITVKPNQNFHKSQHCHIVVLFCFSISLPTWVIRASVHGKVSALCVCCVRALYATLWRGGSASVVFVKAAVGDYRLYSFYKRSMCL